METAVGLSHPVVAGTAVDLSLPVVAALALMAAPGSSFDYTFCPFTSTELLGRDGSNENPPLLGFRFIHSIACILGSIPKTRK